MDKKSDKQHLAILAPAFNEATNIELFVNTVSELRASLSARYRVDAYLVDDGSSDDTWQHIVQQSTLHAWVHGISFSRNFGKESALTAGLENITADAIIITDVDGEHPIGVIPQFIEQWERGSLHVVGIRKKHSSASPSKMFTSWAYHRLLKSLSGGNYTPRATDFRLLDKRVVDQFIKMQEHNRVTRQLIDWLGFTPTYVEYSSPPRWSGEPTYSTRKLINLAVNGVVANTMAPLKLAGLLGLVISFLCVLAGIVIIINEAVGDLLHLGITSTGYLVLLITFLAGVQLISMGLLSIYMESIVSNSRNRPLYVIKDTV